MNLMVKNHRHVVIIWNANSIFFHNNAIYRWCCFSLFDFFLSWISETLKSTKISFKRKEFVRQGLVVIRDN